MRFAPTLGKKLGEATVGSFSDGEIRVKIEENVRGADVFVVQSSCQPVNDSLMELLIIIDALKRSSANRITAVIPYFGYARQDRKDQPRVPITAKFVADLITTAGSRSRADDGSPRRADPGVFQRAGGPSLCAACSAGLHYQEEGRATWWSSRPMPVEWNGPARSRSGFRRIWPSSTSAAKGRIRRRS